MKNLILLLACLFSFNTLATPSYSPLQREAVRFLIEDSHGMYERPDFLELLRSSRLLTHRDLEEFPEVIVHRGYFYVEVDIDDCVYDVAIVVLDPQGQGISSLYIDFSERDVRR